MTFKNREDAGRQLAKRLGAYANREDVTVLGIPRGGVPIAFEIAKALRAPLDIFLSRKLGVPGQEEVAFGAIAAGDGRFLNERVIAAAGISAQQIERITQQVKETLSHRAALYRGDRPPLQVAGRTVILVDDGIASGASIYAAINALGQMKPAELVVAVPVAPASTCAWLRGVVGQLICLYEPERFYAVGQFYENFSQIADEEVSDLLRRAGRSIAPAPQGLARTGELGRVSPHPGRAGAGCPGRQQSPCPGQPHHQPVLLRLRHRCRALWADDAAAQSDLCSHAAAAARARRRRIAGPGSSIRRRASSSDSSRSMCSTTR
jgi:putative phosphoribosyl transferase